MKFFCVLMLTVLFVGCASERSQKRTVHQILSPDKLNMQLHVNPDINNKSRANTEIHQVRIGMDWNL